MSQIGPYEVIEEIGRGGMGVVFRAVDPVIGRPVAIKTIRLDDLSETQDKSWLKDRLFREARSAGILSHPNIVTIYQISEQGDLAYIAMEFVAGPNLEERLSAGKPLDAPTLLETVRQMASALDYAHSKGIVHRDIKPANILISEARDVKITDFGIAKVSLAQTSTRTGAFIGTPFYMSPEQIQGKTVDGRADQYSLAVVAFQMMTGEKPFDADTLTALFFKIVYGDRPAATEINPTLSAGIQGVLHKALAKDPAERFTTCMEFWKALAAACETAPGWQPMVLRATPEPANAEVSAGASRSATRLFEGVQTCPECQALLPVGVIYCGHCGVSLREAAQRAEEKSWRAEEDLRMEGERRRAEARRLSEAKESRGEEEKRAEEARRLAVVEEERRKEEEKRRAEEARVRAAEERKAEEARRLAAVEEARRKEEEKRRAEEARVRAAEERKAEEARRLAAVEEARRKEEEKRRAEEARVRAAEERKAEEARRLAAAEEARRKEEQKRRAEEARVRAAEERKAEEARRLGAAEEARRKEEEKRRAEEARVRAAEERKAEGARRQEEESRRAEDAARQARLDQLRQQASGGSVGEPAETDAQTPAPPQFPQLGGAARVDRRTIVRASVIAAGLLAAVAGGIWLLNRSKPVGWREDRGASKPPASAEPLIQSFTASPDSIRRDRGESVELRWSVERADRVTIDPGVGNVPAAGTRRISPARSTVYRLTAFGGGKTASSTANVVVAGARQNAVTANLTITPAQIRIGDTAELTWDVAGGATVAIDHGIGRVPAKGSRTVRPSVTTTYLLTAASQAEHVTRPATVTVAVAPVAKATPAIPPAPPRPPSVSFRATPETVLPGATTSLHWEVQDASSVSIDKGLGTQSSTGSLDVPVSGSTTFTLTAVGPGGTKTAQATVNVLHRPPPGISFFSADPKTIERGQSATLRWSVANAEKVSIDHGVGGVSDSGSQSVSPAETTEYTLTAQGAGTTKTERMTVTVTQPVNIRVAGSLQQAKLIRRVSPVYPLPALQARVSGVVRFVALIGKEGKVQKLRLINGPPLLQQAAVDAVKQWVYQPTLVDGQPVEVTTTIDVYFTLQ